MPLGRTAWAILEDILKALAIALRWLTAATVRMCMYVCHSPYNKLVTTACGMANITSLLLTMHSLYYHALLLIQQPLRCRSEEGMGCGVCCKYNIWHAAKCTILVTNVCHTYAPKCRFDKSLSVFHFSHPATPAATQILRKVLNV